MDPESTSYDFPVTSPLAVSIKVGAGEVRVGTNDGGVATVRVHPFGDGQGSRNAAQNTTVRLDGDRLTIEGPDGAGHSLFRRGGRLRVEVEVPAESTLRAQLGSADLSLDGQLADATVTSGSGDTTVDRLTGRLTVKTGSGDLRAHSVGGSLSVQSGSGDVSVIRLAGDANVTSASGDVTINDAGAAVTASTASGDVRIGTVHLGDVRVNTASGDVTVGVAAGTSVWLDLATVAGDTRSELDPTPDAPDGAAALSLRVHTVSGDISVRRSQPAAAPATG